MVNQNLKFALRYIISNKVFSVLNIAGLALGLALSITVYMIIYQEISYDLFHKNIKQIYQVFQYERNEKGSTLQQEHLKETVDALSQNVPEFELLVKIPSIPPPPLMINGLSLNDNGIYADENLFKVFSFELIKGDNENVLGSVNNIVISESLAAKYFPGSDPIGKTINSQGAGERFYTVTGIMKDVPVKSSLKFEYIIPLENFTSININPLWIKGQNLTRLYVTINKRSNPAAINQKIASMIPEPGLNSEKELFIFPFGKLHITPVSYKDASGGGMMGAIVVLSILGFMILFVACVNYTNLATALSLKRIKDTGVKKIFGSSRAKLSFQFLLESFIISLIAMILALMLSKLMVPWFNTTFNWNLIVKFSDPLMISGLIIILIVTTLLSGTYPAFYLSGLDPLKILKGSDANGGKNTGLRKILVITQFFFAMLLIIISITCVKQINFIKSRDLGVNIENTVMFNLNKNLLRNNKPLKDEISSLPSVENVSFTSQNPLFIWSETPEIDYDGKGTEILPPFSFIETDFDFIKTLRPGITNGRDFDRSLYTDSSNFIINEKAAKALGSKGTIGSRISFMKKEGTIIGVINDYHMTHMNFPIKPLIILCSNHSYTSAMVKLKEGMVGSGISDVRRIVEKFDKDPELKVTEMRDVFENIYKDNVFKIAKLSIIFSLLSLWIACLGLISISMFNAEIRTKEIGIYKVHGAGVFQIIVKMTYEYIFWVLISMVFAIPAGYLVVNKLFSQTAYHTRLSFWIFALSGIIVLVIALGTVSCQAIRLATKNPAETLKYELK